MANFDSFYGGRQGASFVIVKHFDGVDIPAGSAYQIGWFAKDENNYFYVPLIKRTSSNYMNYAGWGEIPYDGVTIVTSQSGVTSDPLPLKYAEGMKQCFEKGGASTSEVNYGEYVIIDTIVNLGETDNPDNGKVYRRGMNFDSELGGAEYVGQITGPKGNAPELAMTTVEDISTRPYHQIQEYDMTTGDAQDGIVPGKYINGSTGITEYNDEITYGWATIKDRNGNIFGSYIGFTFPYLIPEWNTASRSPYYQLGDNIPMGKNVGDLIDNNYDLLIDNGAGTADRDPSHGDTGHAFYRRWKLSVPKGVKGDSQSQLEVVPTRVYQGASLWDDSSLSGSPVTTADANTTVILTNEPFNIDCIYPYADENAPVAVRKQGSSTIYYCKVKDTYKLQVRYRQTNYDQHQNGDSTMVYIGDFNTIKKIWLAANGYLWVSYNGAETSIINTDNPIKWYESVNVLDDGTIIFTYNTLLPDGITHETQTFDKAIKIIDHVDLDTGLNKQSPSDFDGEGTGTQEIVITWNQETVPGTKDTSVVEGPLNYIMETIVSTYDPKAPNTPANHLLVLYSDPAYRTWLATKYPEKIFSYTSQKFTRINPITSQTEFVTRNDWFDLGYVKGEPGGLHIIGEYTLQSGETYQDYLDDAIPPEDMPGNTPEDRGWAYLIVTPATLTTDELRTIYTYDYVHERWVVVADILPPGIDPTQIIIMDESKIDAETGGIIPKKPEYASLPDTNGLWLIQNNIKSVY